VGDATKSSGFFDVSLDLDYVCVVRDDNLFMATCKCTARARLAIKGNSTGCNYNTALPVAECGNNVVQTAECHDHWQDGCQPRQRGNYPERCDYCGFDTGDEWIQTQWVVSCAVPTGFPSGGGIYNSMCTAVYTEEGSTRNSLPGGDRRDRT
jgi:hypothetical protein